MNYYKISLMRIKSLVLLYVIILMLFITSGCITVKSVSHLREAQEIFNEAASMDNASRFDPGKAFEKNNIFQTSKDFSSARTGYAAALAIIKQMSTEEEKVLKDQKLIGVKLTLEGLILWKLGKYEEAYDIVDQVDNKEYKDQIYERDRIILYALPSLIKIDIAYNKILDSKVSNDVGKKKVLEEVVPLLVKMDEQEQKRKYSAVMGIKKIRGKLDSSHPMQNYLIQSQLAAYCNYSEAYLNTLPVASRFVPDENPYKKEAEYNLQDLSDLAEKLNYSDKIKRELEEHWDHGCNIRPAKRPSP